MVVLPEAETFWIYHWSLNTLHLSLRKELLIGGELGNEVKGGQLMT